MSWSNFKFYRVIIWRLLCIGKKNWQMIDTINGAKASAIIYSIVETAKANSLKPFDYVQYLLGFCIHGRYSSMVRKASGRNP